MGFLRKIRGAIGNGLVWAGAWVLGKLALLVVPTILTGFHLPWAFVPMVIGSAMVTGFINGVLFSAVFAVVNRNRSLREVPVLRTGVLGLAAGATLPVIQVAVLSALGLAMPFSAVAFGLVVGGGLGTLTAVASLRLARAADQPALGRPHESRDSLLPSISE